MHHSIKGKKKLVKARHFTIFYKSCQSSSKLMNSNRRATTTMLNVSKKSVTSNCWILFINYIVEVIICYFTYFRFSIFVYKTPNYTIKNYFCFECDHGKTYFSSLINFHSFWKTSQPLHGSFLGNAPKNVLHGQSNWQHIFPGSDEGSKCCLWHGQDNIHPQTIVGVANRTTSVWKYGQCGRKEWGIIVQSGLGPVHLQWLKKWRENYF